MNYKDLQELLDEIQSDSMCRDEIFYDSEDGYEERRIKFFQLIRKLQRYFEYYLEYEEQIMNTEYDDDGDKVMWNVMKGVNSYSRRKDESDE
jgi:hypothetical protein